MLDPYVKALATGPNPGALSFHLPNGDIATHVMWVDADDEHVIVNTEVGRAKFRAMQTNPRVTLTIIEQGNPSNYVEVRGVVTSTETGARARAHIDELAQRYKGTAYLREIESERVIVRIKPTRQRIK